MNCPNIRPVNITFGGFQRTGDPWCPCHGYANKREPVVKIGETYEAYYIPEGDGYRRFVMHYRDSLPCDWTMSAGLVPAGN